MGTDQAKAPVDLTSLQLHNLMYEKSHYVKAIKACKDFKSKYSDIELVPEEEFFRDAPEDIKCSVLSNDSAHSMMLKRLNFELFQVIIGYYRKSPPGPCDNQQLDGCFDTCCICAMLKLKISSYHSLVYYACLI